MKIFELEPGSPEPKLINEIGSLLKKGGVIAYPTDTVYGLGGDAFNYDVHHRIRTLKGRGGNKPFPFIIDKAERLAEWGIQLNAVASALTRRFWPGPLSIIVEDAGALPGEVLDRRRTMCVRLPASRIARAIAGSVGGLLIATSANPAGGKPAQSARVAADLFKGEIDAVVDGGPSPSALPSTIVDVSGRKMVLLRVGSVSSEQLLQVVSDIERDIYFEEGNGS